MTARDPIEAACTTFLNAEFDELGEAWFHSSERTNFVHDGLPRLQPKMRAAIAAYLQAQWLALRALAGDG